jgi:hypothetical protein
MHSKAANLSRRDVRRAAKKGRRPAKEPFSRNQRSMYKRKDKTGRESEARGVAAQRLFRCLRIRASRSW